MNVSLSSIEAPQRMGWGGGGGEFGEVKEGELGTLYPLHPASNYQPIGKTARTRALQKRERLFTGEYGIPDRDQCLRVALRKSVNETCQLYQAYRKRISDISIYHTSE